MKLYKRFIWLLTALLVVMALTLGGCAEEKDDGNGLGLLVLLGLANRNQSSGFFITIPEGVAK